MDSVSQTVVDAGFEPGVYEEQVRLLYGKARPSSIAILIITLLVWFGLQDMLDPDVLNAWAVYMVFVALSRLALAWLYQHRNPAAEVRTWGALFLVSTTLAGIGWAGVSWFFSLVDDLHYKVAIVMIVLGIMGAGVPVLSASMPVFFSSYPPPAATLIFLIFEWESEVSVLLGFSLILFTLLIGSTAKISNRNWENTLSMQLERQRLIGKLNEEIAERKQIQKQLVIHAEKLEDTVNERTLDLQKINKLLKQEVIEKNASEKKLLMSNERFTSVMDSLDAVVYVADMDTYELLFLNRYTRNLFGDIEGKVCWQSLQLDQSGPCDFCTNSRLVEKNGEATEPYVWEFQNTRTGIWFQCIDRAIPWTGERLVRMEIAIDITERKQAEALIEHQATFDELTDLPNRRLLLDRVENTIAINKRHGHFAALLFVDLDNFKDINDSLGHPIGDFVLKEVALRLKSQLRAEDTSARLGGDEFVVLFSELSNDAEEAAKMAHMGAEKIQKAISVPYRINEYDLNVTSSIGITLLPMEGDSADVILKHADIAMCRAKEAGKNAIRFFLPSMQQAAEERMRLKQDIGRALTGEEFYLEYQPQFDAGGRVIGAEALLRWVSSDRGIMLPDDFISVAEETGQIFSIGEWVLERALNDLLAWGGMDDGFSLSSLAVNISPRQFHQSNFVLFIERLLGEIGAKPECLTLELTEGILIENVDETVSKMAALKNLGVRFSIDDFGTGYSSLAYLKRLPLDELKIDRSFVNDVTTDSNDASLVETIITMADHMGLEVIAEGVETKEKFDFLMEKGCKKFQGFYFGYPASAGELEKLLARDKN
ncbi:MAG: EAL domain-containing protein [Sedimenticola sp.]